MSPVSTATEGLLEANRLPQAEGVFSCDAEADFVLMFRTLARSSSTDISVSPSPHGYKAYAGPLIPPRPGPMVAGLLWTEPQPENVSCSTHVCGLPLLLAYESLGVFGRLSIWKLARLRKPVNLRRFVIRDVLNLAGIEI